MISNELFIITLVIALLLMLSISNIFVSIEPKCTTPKQTNINFKRYAPYVFIVVASYVLLMSVTLGVCALINLFI